MNAVEMYQSLEERLSLADHFAERCRYVVGEIARQLHPESQAFANAWESYNEPDSDELHLNTVCRNASFFLLPKMALATNAASRILCKELVTVDTPTEILDDVFGNRCDLEYYKRLGLNVIPPELRLTCGECHGSGRTYLDDHLPDITCLTCDGTGWLTRPPIWRTDKVFRLADNIFHSNDVSRLPILTDLLSSNGCPISDLIEHLRTPGFHCRGCWALYVVRFIWRKR